jgi:16S rRNA (adenine1518-N6/adenine1519-N6)-dimethyltransferase
VAPTSRDLVVEIGPGEGALTGHLAASGGLTIALEIDRALAERLRERHQGARLEVLDADARRFDYAALLDRLPDPSGRMLVVGNLPYSASKPILMALVEATPAIARRAPLEMALMLQREVAERVAAAPAGKAYGALSVLCQVACEVRLAFVVPPGAFRPAPRVESAVLHLRGQPEPAVPPDALPRFRRHVRAAFSRRRKHLANALAGGLGVPVAEARRLLVAAGIDPGRRAETLTLVEFARLAEAASAD